MISVSWFERIAFRKGTSSKGIFLGNVKCNSPALIVPLIHTFVHIFQSFLVAECVFPFLSVRQNNATLTWERHFGIWAHQGDCLTSSNMFPSYCSSITAAFRECCLLKISDLLTFGSLVLRLHALSNILNFIRVWLHILPFWNNAVHHKKLFCLQGLGFKSGLMTSLPHFPVRSPFYLIHAKRPLINLTGFTLTPRNSLTSTVF